MRIVTLLGIVLAFAMGAVGCNKSSDSYSRQQTTGSESAKNKAERGKSKADHGADHAKHKSKDAYDDTKNKTDSWDVEEDTYIIEEDMPNQQPREHDSKRKPSSSNSNDAVESDTTRVYNVLD